MAIDYSIKGKGNDRKTVNVINEYTYDTKGRIIRHPWDSDVEYLYETTVKFRGTIDPTREAPHHLTVKPGDLYISNGAGTIIDDSDWRNLQGNSIKLGEAILFTDSEIWTTLGTSNVGDSEDITNVDTIYNYKVRMHRDLHKLHYAAVSDTLFFETDSDIMYVFEGEALYPGQPTLIEAQKNSVSVRTAQLTFNNSGALTDGTIRVVGIDRQQKDIVSGSGFTGDSVTSGILSFAGLFDSEGQRASILLETGLEFSYGDEIIFTPNDSHNRSIVKCFDGIGFKRVAKIKMDLDSETHDRQAVDSDILIIIKDNDSEIRRMLDSEIHDRKAADSDIYEFIKLKDSENDSDLRMEIHDRKASDSDILIIIKDNDSEIRRMLDSEIHDRKSVDSDLQVQITDNDSDIQWLYDRDSDFTSAIDSDILALKSKDSDQDIIIKDNDSEIRRMLDSEIHDRKADDSDLWHKLREVDSDLAILFGRTDSDDLTLQDLRTHAEQMIDSERHDWKAADSDLTKDIDSDIQALKDRDSDIFYGKYYTFGVTTDKSVFSAQGPITINLDSATGTYTQSAGQSGWIWFPSVGKLLISIFTTIVESRSLGAEPEQISQAYFTFTKGETTSVQASLFVDGVFQETVFVSNYVYEVPTFQGLPNIRGQIDSDLTLREHLVTTSNTLRWMHHIYNHNDSELNRELDSEIHDRISVDSDHNIRITDNESDIQWLYDRDSDFTTQIDSDILALYSADSDIRVRLDNLDSDIVQAVHDYLANDSEFDSDLKQIIHDYLYNDSDLWHDVWEADSDLKVRITDNDSDIHALYAFDSDLTKNLDSDLHDLRAKDSDLQVQITDNDSDIAYLYNVTVKFRGTVDPTTDGPLHTEVKPGDMYVSNGSGSFLPSWDGVDGLSVNVGDTLLYTDSERWISLGVAEIGDSETIHQIPSLSWFNSQPHTTRNKIYWGSHSRNAFFEIDSDVVVRVPTDFPLFPSLIEGSTNQANNQHVDLSFTNVGPNTSGTLRYNAADDTDVTMSIVAGATGTAVDSELINFIVDDSEHMTATIGVNRVPAKGDYIEYRDHASKQASRVQFDGVRGWLKWDESKWVKQDLDSDAFWLEKEIASSIGGFRVGTIQAFATTDMPVGFRIADGSQYNTAAHPDLFRILGTDTLPDLRGAILRGFSTDFIKDKNGPNQPGDENIINLGAQGYAPRGFQNANTSARVSNTQATVTYTGRGGPGGDDSDVVWDATTNSGAWSQDFQLSNLFNAAGNGYLPTQAQGVADITVAPRDPNTYLAAFRILPGRTNDHGYRNIQVTWTFQDGHVYQDHSNNTTAVGGHSSYVTFENDYIESPVSSIRIVAFAEWASDAGLRNFQPAFFQDIDSDQINPIGGRSHAVAYGIAMYDGAAVVFDSDIIRSVFNEYIIRVDSEIARIDSDWKRNTDSDRHNWKAADSDLRVRITDNDSDILWLYNRDSDFTSNIDSDILALKAKDSDQDIIIADNDSEIHRQLDSEIHDRKAADSDLLSIVGRTFVGLSIDPNLKPPLRRGDVWIDTSNQKMYYYDEDTEAWVQVISTTSP